eukprot:GEMP01092534.1.p1 GENE.GEMP01092534.1~~GEMP01092534.1.p1  ORF type:complete len:223 (+),score=24.53 GEMP01092534.1:165-833(+)
MHLILMLTAGVAASLSVPHVVLTDGLAPVKTTGSRGLTVWMTGIPGSGKTTIAAEAVRQFTNRTTYRLDGDLLRQGLNSDLGFSAADRNENNRRTAEVAKLFNELGVVVICALISPYAADRAFARKIHDENGMLFMEVFVDAPLSVTESRDPKGLYRLVREGIIKEFTGVSSPYETPTDPDLHIETHTETIEVSVQKLMTSIEQRLQNDTCLEDKCSSTVTA